MAFVLSISVYLHKMQAKQQPLLLPENKASLIAGFP
jgi:hypothetical protein